MRESAQDNVISVADDQATASFSQNAARHVELAPRHWLRGRRGFNKE